MFVIFVSLSTIKMGKRTWSTVYCMSTTLQREPLTKKRESMSLETSPETSLATVPKKNLRCQNIQQKHIYLVVWQHRPIHFHRVNKIPAIRQPIPRNVNVLTMNSRNLFHRRAVFPSAISQQLLFIQLGMCAVRMLIDIRNLVRTTFKPESLSKSIMAGLQGLSVLSSIDSMLLNAARSSCRICNPDLTRPHFWITNTNIMKLWWLVIRYLPYKNYYDRTSTTSLLIYDFASFGNGT